MHIWKDLIHKTHVNIPVNGGCRFSTPWGECPQNADLVSPIWALYWLPGVFNEHLLAPKLDGRQTLVVGPHQSDPDRSGHQAHGQGLDTWSVFRQRKAGNYAWRDGGEQTATFVSQRHGAVEYQVGGSCWSSSWRVPYVSMFFSCEHLLWLCMCLWRVSPVGAGYVLRKSVESLKIIKSLQKVCR